MIVEIKKWIKKHKILSWILGVIVTFALEELVKFIFKLLFKFKISMTIKFGEAGDVPLGIILVILVVIVLGLLLLNLHFREKNRHSFQSQNDDKKSINEMMMHKDFFEKLAEQVETKRAVQSVQIYECSDLPDPNSIPDNRYAVLKFKRIGGYSKTGYKTNCILFEEFVCSKRVYSKLYGIIISARNIYSSIDSATDYDHGEMTVLINNTFILINDLIKNEFSKLSRVDKIKDEFYFYYRVYLLLVKLAYDFSRLELSYSYNAQISGSKNIICSKKEYMLEDFGVPHTVENQLKRGKRTGILGAFLLDRMQLFGHEHSLTKNDRSYFASPLHKNRIYVVTYANQALNLTQEDSEYSKCKEIFSNMVLELGDNV